MISKQKRCLFSSAVVMLFVFTASVVAQVRMPPPRRGFERPARVQYISGEVSVAPSSTSQWTPAQLNQSLPPSEYVWTGANSRAEINVGGGLIRMNSEASVTLLALNRSTVQIGVNQGEVSLTVLGLAPGEIYELDTPNATLTVTKPGVYRVEVTPTEDVTIVTTRKGSIVATGSGNAVTVNSGQQVKFRGGKSMQHTAQKAPPPDGFEDWASVRDKRLAYPRPVPFGVVVGYGPYGPWPYGPRW
jgi:ferric-dicitrate binding protein FerR (iron transport regulator)